MMNIDDRENPYEAAKAVSFVARSRLDSATGYYSWLWILVLSSAFFLCYGILTVIVTIGFGFHACSFIFVEQLSVVYEEFIGVPILLLILIVALTMNAYERGVARKNAFIVFGTWLLACVPSWFVGGILIGLSAMSAM